MENNIAAFIASGLLIAGNILVRNVSGLSENTAVFILKLLLRLRSVAVLAREDHAPCRWHPSVVTERLRQGCALQTPRSRAFNNVDLPRNPPLMIRLNAHPSNRAFVRNCNRDFRTGKMLKGPFGSSAGTAH